MSKAPNGKDKAMADLITEGRTHYRAAQAAVKAFDTVTTQANAQTTWDNASNVAIAIDDFLGEIDEIGAIRRGGYDVEPTWLRELRQTEPSLNEHTAWAKVQAMVRHLASIRDQVNQAADALNARYDDQLLWNEED